SSTRATPLRTCAGPAPSTRAAGACCSSPSSPRAGAPGTPPTGEVFDASNTAPHLRRARAFDEGGRGLLLVAQLTQGWGTRHTAYGKAIWCSQPLPTP
ncbi:ATP-binding protein, partial [Streptomyces sp. NPDC048142]|uniref:ATP-binding protein n=1 Tax=Streptomyces sp. NPDC048142 TaxID=3365501 RepID=UPI003714A355